MTLFRTLAAASARLTPRKIVLAATTSVAAVYALTPPSKNISSKYSTPPVDPDNPLNRLLTLLRTQQASLFINNTLITTAGWVLATGLMTSTVNGFLRWNNPNHPSPLAQKLMTVARAAYTANNFLQALILILAINPSTYTDPKARTLAYGAHVSAYMTLLHSGAALLGFFKGPKAWRLYSALAAFNIGHCLFLPGRLMAILASYHEAPKALAPTATALAKPFLGDKPERNEKIEAKAFEVTCENLGYMTAHECNVRIFLALVGGIAGAAGGASALINLFRNPDYPNKAIDARLRRKIPENIIQIILRYCPVLNGALFAFLGSCTALIMSYGFEGGKSESSLPKGDAARWAWYARAAKIDPLAFVATVLSSLVILRTTKNQRITDLLLMWLSKMDAVQLTISITAASILTIDSSSLSNPLTTLHKIIYETTVLGPRLFLTQTLMRSLAPKGAPSIVAHTTLPDTPLNTTYMRLFIEGAYERFAAKGIKLNYADAQAEPDKLRATIHGFLPEIKKMQDEVAAFAAQLK